MKLKEQTGGTITCYGCVNTISYPDGYTDVIQGGSIYQNWWKATPFASGPESWLNTGALDEYEGSATSEVVTQEFPSENGIHFSGCENMPENLQMNAFPNPYNPGCEVSVEAVNNPNIWFNNGEFADSWCYGSAANMTLMFNSMEALNASGICFDYNNVTPTEPEEEEEDETTSTTEDPCKKLFDMGPIEQDKFCKKCEENPIDPLCKCCKKRKKPLSESFIKRFQKLAGIKK